MPMIHGPLPTDLTLDTGSVEEARDLAALLSVLADPTRLAVLQHLRGGEHRVGELSDHLGLAQSTVSQHLGLLRDAGLISTHTHGRARVSRLEHEDLLTTVLVTTRALLTAASAASPAAATDAGRRP
ncbi:MULTISPECIES: metalloregulator ArsR/SmtB family transcription factor [unclassified Actinomyces]|uniref:ArsR/SmtB family transcription factor n=1 Tax=unclassified Actinomyces TaxID=2609248 RepID=UPI0020175ED0|nr:MULTISPECIES: metalloregulator ArsR/SmtB family transcription factor [unclassified Actinomyces]MCL3777716.1 winged helix-turn-helix transcriptional regulator [Actinomyces sp. AC-20-1]MCL3789844.1 winged helix-turn-helix transcriptional regulator [Actinomyces sp. 187325]MCL3791516.1 winged helix-turn-helix transcriptional regulator [Actinomyces sp. 186855]MCL3793831.1 winged helix-turn-helix transcriptional regulator [Actinomyces sp. 217892]